MNMTPVVYHKKALSRTAFLSIQVDGFFTESIGLFAIPGAGDPPMKAAKDVVPTIAEKIRTALGKANLATRNLKITG